jgi:PAS domain-containing protein
MVDLSRKRSAQEAVGEGKIWLREVVDTIPQQIWSGPPEGRIDFVNERWRTELGITIDGVQAHPASAWQNMLHSEDRDNS